MNKTELSILISDIPAIKAELQADILSAKTASTITRRIIELNYHIDKMADNKNSYYYALVECCHAYYRLFDAFL